MDRIERFAAALSDAGMAAALIMNPPDVYYLSGTGQPANLLVVPGEEPILFSRRYHELTRASTHVERVLEGAGFGAVVEHVPEGTLGMELDRVPGGLVDSARRRFGEIADCAPLLLAQRSVKDAGEIEAMRESVGLFDAVHATLLEFIRPGITELELAAEVERALRRAGHDGVVFQRRWDAKLPMEGSLASGENLSTISRGPVTVTGVGQPGSFPMGASTRELRRGDLVLIDLGLNRAGYHGDMARTYAVEELPDGVEALARKCRELQDVALEAIRPGVPAHHPYDVTREAAERLGLADVFQGGGPYIGHSIGLELDEPPVLGPGVETPIEEGMVLAVEPKLISPAFGAVNIEDDVVVTADGCEILGGVPRSVFVVGENGELARVP